MKKPLTSKQQSVLGFIKDYINSNKKSPTREEIKGFLGVKSINSVSQYLDVLEENSYISRRKHDKRNIDLISNTDVKKWFTLVPVMASIGCDDLSVFAEDAADEFLQVSSDLVSIANPIAIRAIGNSMNDSGIENGDYVLIDKNAEIKNGDRVVAIVDGMATLKRLEKRADIAILWPESKDPKYKPIIVNQDFKLVGKVITVIPKYFNDEMRYEPINN